MSKVERAGDRLPDSWLSPTTRALQQGFEQRCQQIGVDGLVAGRAAAERDLQRRGVAFYRKPVKTYFRPAADDGLVPVDPVPLAVSAGDWNRLAHGYAQRLPVFNELLRALAGGEDLIPEEIRAVHRESLPALAVLAEQSHPVTFVGSDVMVDRDGQPVLVEDNVCAAGAAVYPYLLNAAVQQSLPEFDDIPAIGPDVLGAGMRRVHEELCDTYGTPRMVYLSHGPGDVNFVESVIIAEVGGFVLADPEDVDVAPDGTAWLRLGNGGRATIDLIYCNQSARYEISQQLLAAIPKQKVRVVNHPAAFTLNDKYLMAVIPDLLRNRLRMEPALPQAHTLLMTEPVDRRQVLDHLRDYVIKPRHGIGGQDVTVGTLASEAALTRVRQRVQADPGRYLAQPRVDAAWPLCLGSGSGGDRLCRAVVDLRITGYHANQSYVGPLALGRTDLAGAGLVNVSAGGALKPVFRGQEEE